ncbi:hypothetical protein EPO15_06325, partial [bacterium]
MILPGLDQRVAPRPQPAQPSPLDPVERLSLPLYPTPEGTLAYLGGRFTFDMPHGWKYPLEAPGGAVLVDADGRAGAGAAFHAAGSADWEDPADFKHRLRSLGGLEDSPLLETVVVGGRFGSRRRWTTHRYKGPWTKLGAEPEVLLTETLLVPDLEGIY